MSKKFILPQTSLQKLEHIIQAYYHAEASMTSTELSKSTNNAINPRDIAGCVTFLSELGVITPQGGNKFQITEFGIKLADAIMNSTNRRSKLLEVAIDKSRFLKGVYKGLLIKKNVKYAELIKDIISSTGRQPKKNSVMGARTIISILVEGKNLCKRRVDGVYYVGIDEKAESSSFIRRDRMDALEQLNGTNGKFNLSKLIELCREINICNGNEAYFAVGLLIRTVLNHVPPIFGFGNFKEVAHNYGGNKSFKENMQNLENYSRKIADRYAHDLITQKENLPNSTQINFSASIDILLQEIIDIFESELATEKAS